MGWELELTDAVYNNDIELVKQYLQTKEVKKSLGRHEWNWSEAPIHRAAAIGRNEILRLLVESGGDLRSFSIHDNDDKLTCLHLAVWCNQAETVRLLLQLGADPNQAGTWLDYSGTPWDFALQYKHAAIMEIFREYDKDGKFAGSGNFAGPNSMTMKARFGANTPTVVTRVSTSAILTGLENLSLKEKALKKAQDLQKKFVKSEKHLQECKRQMAMAEKDVFDIQTNPYFLSLDSIDELTMEIEELKVFSVEVRKVLRDEPQGFHQAASTHHRSSHHHHNDQAGHQDSYQASSVSPGFDSRGRVQGRRAEREGRGRSSSGHRYGDQNGGDSSNF